MITLTITFITMKIKSEEEKEELIREKGFKKTQNENVLCINIFYRPVSINNKDRDVLHAFSMLLVTFSKS